MNYGVMIPSNNGAKLSHVLDILFVKQPSLKREDVLVVDDGAKSRVGPWLLDRVTWIEPPKPFLFARNFNIGAAALGNRDMVFLEDDCLLFSMGGLDRLAASAAANPKTCFVTAALRGQRLIERVKLKNNKGLVRKTNWLPFVCCLFTRDGLKKVGALDESFTGYGFDDCDWFARAADAGMSWYVDGEVVADHALPSGFQQLPEIRELHRQGSDQFLAKWGKRAEALARRFDQGDAPEPPPPARVSRAQSYKPHRTPLK